MRAGLLRDAGGVEIVGEHLPHAPLPERLALTSEEEFPV